MSNAEVPALPSDFSHADISGVAIGPRRELTLTLVPVVWSGGKGRRGPAVRVRFGGIVNMPEVEAVFAADPHKSSELAWLRYDQGRRSKPGDLHLRLEFERVEAGVTVHCGSVSVTEVEQPDA